MRVLDFGCGLGMTAARIAERVRTIAIWDESASMRRRAFDRISRVGRADLLDLSAGAPTGVQPFDLILVHSVVQYVTERELEQLMALWAAVLETSGVVILSDVVPERSNIVHDIVHTVAFSIRRGVRFAAGAAMLREFARYAAARKRAPLLRLSVARVAAMAAAAGLECRALDANLGFRRNRLSFVLSRRSTLR
jgi:predicted TPR repeat methyltransferase